MVMRDDFITDSKIDNGLAHSAGCCPEAPPFKLHASNVTRQHPCECRKQKAPAINRGLKFSAAVLLTR